MDFDDDYASWADQYDQESRRYREENETNWPDISSGPQSERNEMNINEVFPSNYLKASDLGGKKIRLTISHVDMENLGNESKPVVYFEGKQKGLVLNKTKAQILAAAYSPETNGWKGRDVGIYPTKVNFQGQMVDSIGLEPIASEAVAGEEPDFKMDIVAFIEDERELAILRRELSRMRKHTAAIRDHWHSITYMKCALNEDDEYMFKEAWDELDAATQTALWMSANIHKADKASGIWTPEEKAKMKEWGA
jgi:hypothetical protein